MSAADLYEKYADQIAQVDDLRALGLSNVMIGKRLNLSAEMVHNLDRLNRLNLSRTSVLNGAQKQLSKEVKCLGCQGLFISCNPKINRICEKCHKNPTRDINYGATGNGARQASSHRGGLNNG